MAKNLKLNIKNTQIAEAINLSGLKNKLAARKKPEEEQEQSPAKKKSPPKAAKAEKEELPKEEAPRIRARSKSAFAEPQAGVIQKEPEPTPEETIEEVVPPQEAARMLFQEEHEELQKAKTSSELRQELFKDELKEIKEAPSLQAAETLTTTPIEHPIPETTPAPLAKEQPAEKKREQSHVEAQPASRLGPTGKHIKDFLKPKPLEKQPPGKTERPQQRTIFTTQPPTPKEEESEKAYKGKPKPKESGEAVTVEDESFKKGAKQTKFKEFRDVKPSRKQDARQFDARDRQGLRASDEEQEWRRRRNKQQVRPKLEEVAVRPTTLNVRTPISIKDLAGEMKLKASELIAKLFLQGVAVTLNDLLEDETTIQLLGQEFGCEITIDRTEEKRIRITDETIKEELQKTNPDILEPRPPVVAFMGHVDHGKTSLIDFIRKSNRASGEAGAITQHIGAFRCSTAVGDITVLDTPGHEAFSAMRARGADVTDIVVLVVAGDEGLRQQSLEAVQHARAAKVTIVVAINKSDKPNFNAENVYRQLAENDLLPEVWGGQIITVNCSAVTGQGVPELLEMLALQAEVLELKANPNTRARGSVLESELHKGLGRVTTVLVQNGTLRKGDALVFGEHWGRIKTMRNEYGKELEQAGPSTPLEITGLSGLPEAGQEFIVVKNEKEARDISEARTEGARQSNLLLQQKKKTSMENLFQQATDGSTKKILNVVLRSDVQGSLEALKAALLKIESQKAEINIIFTGVGEISESDVQLAAASKAVILGFHVQAESHAEQLMKQLGVQIRLHDIIYHAIDDMKLLMAGLLDKIAQETEKGKALVKATFKSSQAGVIAGCQVIEGVIQRNNMIRLKRGEEVVWKGSIASLKRVKEDVKEVQKGMECGILLNGFSDINENDILEAFEVTYISQEL